jgi:hypothetical protein
MFEPVARANIHQQQLLNLLKQRARLHQNCLYPAQRMVTLEQQVFAHLYALQDAPQDSLKPEVAMLIEVLQFYTAAQLSEQQTIEPEQSIEPQCWLEQLLEYYQQALDDQDLKRVKAIQLVQGLLPIAYLHKRFSMKAERPFLESLMYQRSALLEVIPPFCLDWPEELLQIARQSALAGQFIPSRTAACLLFSGAKITNSDLALGYAHSHFAIAMASLLKGLVQDPNNAQQALFSRFAITTDVTEKVRLLGLASNTADSRWVEPCYAFCSGHPEHCFEVLSQFQHKVFLPMIIDIMALPQCTEQAYRAWLLLTDAELQQKPLLQDVADQHRQAGAHCVPNPHHAEHVRQALLGQPGDCVLAGVSFYGWMPANDGTQSKAGFNTQQYSKLAMKLRDIQGRAVQASLGLSCVANYRDQTTVYQVLAGYHQPLSAGHFQALLGPMTQQKSVLQQASNANIGVTGGLGPQQGATRYA